MSPLRWSQPQLEWCIKSRTLHRITRADARNTIDFTISAAQILNSMVYLSVGGTGRATHSYVNATAAKWWPLCWPLTVCALYEFRTISQVCEMNWPGCRHVCIAFFPLTPFARCAPSMFPFILVIISSMSAASASLIPNGHAQHSTCI